MSKRRHPHLETLLLLSITATWSVIAAEPVNDRTNYPAASTATGKPTTNAFDQFAVPAEGTKAKPDFPLRTDAVLSQIDREKAEQTNAPRSAFGDPLDVVRLGQPKASGSGVFISTDGLFLAERPRNDRVKRPRRLRMSEMCRADTFAACFVSKKSSMTSSMLRLLAFRSKWPA